MTEFDRRLAIAVEAARNQGQARGGVLDLLTVRQHVLAGLSDAELAEVVVRGLAGDPGAKEALATLLLRLAAGAARLRDRAGDVERVVVELVERVERLESTAGQWVELADQVRVTEDAAA